MRQLRIRKRGDSHAEVKNRVPRAIFIVWERVRVLRTSRQRQEGKKHIKSARLKQLLK